MTAMPAGEIALFDRGDGVRLACARQPGAAPTFVWLPGFRSDMAGSKARALAQWADARGRALLRFDYSGHGRSEGAFQDGTISRWLADTLAVLDTQSEGPLVLAGSSMGAWLALLAARARPARTAGLLLIAPAADFTEALIWERLSTAEQRRLAETGRLERPSAYDAEPDVITRALIEDGRAHLVLGAPIAFAGSVRIVQGKADPDVPWRHARRLADNFASGAAAIDFIDGGDHRLARPEDITRILAAADDLAAALS
jgi:pimeloyl-ACP methyl ester carboxylesterase